jgi:hypothetical protein
MLVPVLLLAAPARFSVQAIEVAERGIDAAFDQVAVTEPMLRLNPTQGTYVEGFGLVLQQEVNVKPVAALSPFKPSYTKAEKEKIRQTKIEKLPMLRAAMRDMLIATARQAVALPESERIVLSVKLFHWAWEDKTGLPGLVVMQAAKRPLLSSNRQQAEEAIESREY